MTEDGLGDSPLITPRGGEEGEEAKTSSAPKSNLMQAMT